MATQAIAFPVDNIEQMKVLLASWYTFLGEKEGELDKSAFSEYLKTPVMYNMGEDKLEILFCGTTELLEQFKVRFSEAS